MKRIIHTIWLPIAVLVMVVLAPAKVVAQCDAGTLNHARQLLVLEDTESLIDTLSGCLKGGFRSDDDIFSAYLLIGKAYIAEAEIDSARKYVKQAVMRNRSYSPTATDESQVLLDLVALAKTELERKVADNALDAVVVTATKRAQRSSDAPASIYVITREEIYARGYFNLMELLDDIPEVEIQRNSVAEYKNQATFRGITGNEKFIIMLDGFRITPATGDPYVLGTNFSLANAERVEVILGPASALYGVDAFTGIVNIISREGSQLKGAEVTTSYGNYSTIENALVVGGGRKRLSWMVTAQHYNSAEADLQNIYRDEFSWYHDVYNTDNPSMLSGSDTVPVSGFDTEFHMPTRSHYLQAHGRFDNLEIGGIRHYESHSSAMSNDPALAIYDSEALFSSHFQQVYARHSYRNKLYGKDTTKSIPITLQSMFSAGEFETAPSTRFINSFTGFEEGFKYQFATSAKLEEQLELEFNKSSLIVGGSYESLSALPKTGDLPFAFDPRRSGDSQNQYWLGTDIANEDGDTLIVFHSFYYLKYQNIGAYAQYTHLLFDSLMELTLGSRFDRNTRFGNSYNPRAGLVVKPSDKLKIKLLYGQAFLAPSPWKAYSTFGSISPVTNAEGEIEGLTSGFLHVPNGELGPERMKTGEGSVNYFLNKNVLLWANGYYNRVDSLINIAGTQITNTSFRTIPVSFLERPANDSTAHVYGGTVGAKLVFAVGDSIPERQHKFRVFAAYSYSGGTIERDNLYLSAPHTLRTIVTYQRGGLSLSTRLLYRTASYSDLTDADGEQLQNEPFHTVNLFASYTWQLQAKSKSDLPVMRTDGFAHRLSVFAKVTNVTNQRNYHVPYSDPNSFAMTPQDPIRWQVGVRYGISAR